MSDQPQPSPASRPKPKRGTVKAGAPDAIEIAYALAELPSAQHRAGLAGLVMMAQWLERQPRAEGQCVIVRLDDAGVTFRFDRAGLGALFDELYDADKEEAPKKQLWKDRSGEVIPPVRTEEREVPDGKGNGKTRKEKVYFYEIVVPKAGLLRAHEPPRADGATPWVKLWRDMVWETLRGVPATRAPFQARAERRATTDAADAWGDLIAPAGHSVELPSTYYLGAQATTAENVAFRDRARSQFLLHFWPYATQIYVPQTVSAKDGKTEFAGYALAVPDVAALRSFCEELPFVLRQRGGEMAAYRPREAVIDVPAEGALDQARRLRERIALREGDKAGMSGLVLGFEVFHLKKEGNSVRLLGVSRVEPEERMINEYVLFRSLKLWSPIFRRRRLTNLLDGKPWYQGFERVIATLPQDKLTIGSPAFCHDAMESFRTSNREREARMSDEEREGDGLSLEGVIYDLMRGYTIRKLKAKYPDLKEKTKEHTDKRQKIAKEAFLAVRSRAGADFVDYFASTLCSVPQYLPPARFALITRALRDRDQSEHVRALTLLALSAASWTPTTPAGDRHGASEE